MGKISKALEKAKRMNSLAVGDLEAHREAIGTDKALEEVHISSSVPPPPWTSNGYDKKLIVMFNPKSHEAEQIRTLRTNLLFPASGTPPRVIMVTSSVPGEGKTFISTNLAVSIAQNIDEHVLLMDCDLRKPSVHRIFGFGDVPGLSEYLLEDRELSSLILKTKLDKLRIVAAGKPADYPAEILSSEKMSRMIQEVRNRYDDRYIVIDSPPPYFASEASAIAKQVDGVLVVLEYGKTRRETVSELLKDLKKANVLGVVVNWFNSGLSTFKGYGRYNKYYKYHKYYRET